MNKKEFNKDWFIYSSHLLATAAFFGLAAIMWLIVVNGGTATFSMLIYNEMIWEIVLITACLIVNTLGIIMHYFRLRGSVQNS